jgi:hypothetical protein
MYSFEFSKSVAVKASIEINRPILEVFEYVGENFFENYQKWAPEVTQLKPLNTLEISEGAQAQQVRMEQGQRLESVFEVSEYDRPKRLTLKGISQPYRNSYEFYVCGNDSTGLDFEFELLEVDMFMRPFEKLIRMSIEEGAEHTLANIKSLLTTQH